MSVTIKIEVTENGQVGITGPLHDKVLCYGLLNVAMDIVRSHKVPTSPVVTLPPGSRVLKP